MTFDGHSRDEASQERGGEAPDLILLGGTVVTMDDDNPRAEAVAVRDGRIAAVGRRSELLELRGSSTEVVDLGGRALLPGFHEPHVHPDLSALLGAWADVSGFDRPDPDRVWAALRDAVARAEPGEWVWAFGWDPMLTDRLPSLTRRDLDEVAPDNPVFVLQQNMHTAYVNSRALELAGISRETPDPGHGGLYERDADGDLTGKLIEAPTIFPFVLTYGLPSKDGWRERFEAEYLRLAAGGVTSITSAGLVMPADTLPALEAIAADGPAVRQFVFVADVSRDQLGDRRPGDGSDALRYKGVKFWYDGSPYTGTMLMDEPYLDNDYTCGCLRIPPGTVGQANWESEPLVDAMADLHAQGWQLAVHTQGDRASREIADVYEAVVGRSPRPDHRHRIEHGVFVDNDTFDRVVALGITTSFHVNHIWFYGRICHDHLLGEARSNQMVPIRRAFDADNHPSLHSDRPMFWSTPLELAHTAVNRSTREGGTIGPGLAISVEEALRAITLHPAWQVHEEDRIGSLEAGKLADIVVLSDDPLAVPPERLRDVGVEATYLSGRPVFQH